MGADERAFYDRLWADRPEALNDDERARLAEISRLVAAAGPPFGAILEVGCGTGWLSEALAALGPLRGVDTSPEAIAQARRRHPGLRFDLAGATDPLGDGEFDLVVSSEVIEHVADQPAFLRRIAAALKPGGRLVMTTPNARARPWWEALDPPRQPIEAWLDGAGLEALARGGGLEPLASRSFFTSFTASGRYRLVNSARLRRFLGAVGASDLPARAAERLGWGLYLSLLARRPR